MPKFRPLSFLDEAQTEFTTALSLNECRQCLSKIEAKVWDVKPLFRHGKEKIGFLWYGKPHRSVSRWSPGIGLLGELTATPQGTQVRATMYRGSGRTVLYLASFFIALCLIVYTLVYRRISIGDCLCAILLLGLYCLFLWFVVHFFMPRWRELALRLQEKVLASETK